MIYLTKEDSRKGKKLIQYAQKEYQKELRKIALKVKRGTKNSFRWIDMAERAKWDVENKYISESRHHFGWYNKFEKQISEAVESIDRNIFAKQTQFSGFMYDFSNEKLLSII